MISLVLAVIAAQGPERAVVQTHIAAEVAIDYEAATVDIVAALTRANTGGVAVSRVPLQLGRELRVTAVEDGPGNALRFTQEVTGYQERPAFEINQVWVELREPLAAGGRTTVRLRYGGHIAPYVEAGLGYVRDHVSRAFTMLRADARTWPVISGPSFADLFARQRPDFTFTLRLRVPAGLSVATGVPERAVRRERGAAIWEFDGVRPVPFLNVAIAPYEVLERDGIRVFHFADDSLGAAEMLRAAWWAVEAYGRWFGPLDSLRLHVIEIPAGWGSQASLTGGIIQTADAFRSAGARGELYHELAHLWHPAELDAPAARFTEGLATFLAERVTAEVDRAGALDRRMAERAEALIARLADRPGADTVPMLDYGVARLTDYAYSVGALMFYALYRVLGPSCFDAALGGWMREERGAGTTARGFADRLAAAPAAGPVLEDWLFTARWFERLSEGGLGATIDGYRERGEAVCTPPGSG